MLGRVVEWRYGGVVDELWNYPRQPAQESPWGNPGHGGGALVK